MAYEKATDELRQVTAACDFTFNHDGRVAHFPTFVVKVQRKWLVQNGESFYYPTQPSAYAVKTGDWHPIKPHLGFQWTPVKAEWRDLPTVTESEARHS